LKMKKENVNKQKNNAICKTLCVMIESRKQLQLNSFNYKIDEHTETVYKQAEIVTQGIRWSGAECCGEGGGESVVKVVVNPTTNNIQMTENKGQS